MSVTRAKTNGGTLMLKKGNDEFYLGKGMDIIRVGLNNGSHNNIYDFDCSKDILEIPQGFDFVEQVKYSLVGNDLILQVGNTKLMLKTVATKGIRYRTQGSKQVRVINFSKALDKNLSYAKNDWTKVVANENFSGLFDMESYNENLKTFDARNVKKAVFIGGSRRNDVIYAGNYGSDIFGSYGNDTIYLGKGNDVICVGQGDGHDVIYNYDVKNDFLCLDRNIDDFSVSGKDLTLREGNAKITLKNIGKFVTEFNTSMFNIRCSIQGSQAQSLWFFDNTGLSYKKNDKTTLVASDKFKGYADLSIYDNVKTFDGRAAKKRIYIDGAALRSEVIYAGHYGSTIRPDQGNDTVICGNGADTIEYQNDDGNDTIVNFNAKKDLVKLTSECGDIKKAAVDGKDLVITVAQNKKYNHGNGTIRFKGGAVMNGIRIKGNRSAQTRTYAQAVVYDRKNCTLTALTTNVGGTYNLGAFAANGITLNAGKLKTKATLIGNAQNNKITAGQAGGDIKAGKGNDTITCGNGEDRIWFAKSEGKDTVLKSGKNDVAYLYGVKDINQVTKKLTKGVMTLGIKGASDTLNISGWQAGKSLSTVELANHKKYTFGADGNFKLVK